MSYSTSRFSGSEEERYCATEEKYSTAQEKYCATEEIYCTAEEGDCAAEEGLCSRGGIVQQRRDHIEESQTVTTLVRSRTTTGTQCRGKLLWRRGRISRRARHQIGPQQLSAFLSSMTFVSRKMLEGSMKQGEAKKVIFVGGDNFSRCSG